MKAAKIFFQNMSACSFYSNLSRFSKYSIAAISCLFLLASCSSTPPAEKQSLKAENPDQILWPFEEKAITIHFQTDKDLNLYDQRPHSLSLCVYQMNNSRKFKELAKTPEGIETLLKAEAFGDEIKGVDRFFLQPHEKGVFYLDRAEDANIVGIVAGYFDSKKHIAKVWKIPPVENSSGWKIWQATTYSAGPLELNLRFTATRMAEVKGTLHPDRKNKRQEIDNDMDDESISGNTAENAETASDLTQLYD